MNDLNFNIFNLIIISGVLHGIIFSVIVFSQKKNIENNTIYLGLTVLFLSLSNFQYWLIVTNITNKYQFLNYIFIPWQWLILPMFYMYVHKFIGRNKLSLNLKKLILSPFLIVLLIHIIQITLNCSHNTFQKASIHFQKGIYVYIEFASFFFNVLIIFFVYKMILKHEKYKCFNILWVKSETNWLKKLIFTGLVICLFWLIGLIFIVIFNLNKTYIFYPLWIGISILIYWIGYVGINKSQQLKNRIEIRKKRILEYKHQELKTHKINNSKSYKKLRNHIKINKSFLNPNLSLEILSEELNLSAGYLSQLINKNSNLSFNDFINSLRVNDAKAMLINTDFNNYTIVAIGLEAGFNSKSSFYSAFKKFTGKTPIEYKKSIRNH
ncbi:helix-turn-helix domain-containing protein [Algibacter sp. PT7-4]|uniref:helix-turn-helix domain-containing protein n=1 Tax=Algibacter ulvanivorans TaxID=3400999 RepID=UPI003AAB2C87